MINNNTSTCVVIGQAPELESLLNRYSISDFLTTPLLENIWKKQNSFLKSLLEQQQTLQNTYSTILGKKVFFPIKITGLKPLQVHSSNNNSKNFLHPVHLIDLNASYTPHQLTALHLAVITNNLDAVKLLVEAGASPNSQDVHGWTPLHHASFVSNPSILKALEASQLLIDHLKTDTGGTYKNYQQMLNALSYTSPSCVKYLNPITKQMEELSTEQFKKLTGARFLPETYVTPRAIYEQWCLHSPAKMSDMDKVDLFRSENFFKKKWKGAGSHSVDLYLGIEPTLSKVCTHKKIFGVFANQRIPKGTIIAEYAGIISKCNFIPTTDLLNISTKDTDANYRLEDIDALDYRNMIPMINDSFPNCSMENLVNDGGLAKRSILISTKGIEQGEQLHWPTLEPSLLMFQHIELAPESVERFIKETPIAPFLERLNSKTISESRYREDLFPGIVEYFYLFSTPSFIMHSYFERKLSIDFFLELRKKDYFKNAFLISENSSLLTSLKEFDVKYKTFSPQVQERIKFHMLKFIDMGRIQTGLSLLMNRKILDKMSDINSVETAFYLLSQQYAKDGL